MSDKMEWFALEFGLSVEDVAELEKMVRKEFPNDEMMYELHLIRALMQREEEKKNLSFEEMKKMRDERLKKGLAEAGFKLVKLDDGTHRIKKIRSR